ncbi:CBS domain-containing protein [Exilibacterium tricleocarpae]|uniref:CBS domain-containing protein n=1 Tax=Exilibacterium tricleocarpae TaxID=2591008 RepID=A0A545U877_9GAMM|nr:DUF294 nucleotidyltransferase-like domain-containing protein [Exilibacterium tricleocarpae]TQV85666.1 CBS domain-containing protein [Exilibacterium tricleocarpae]
MVGEIPEITGFIRTCPPFDKAEEEALTKLVRHLSVSYHKSGDTIDLAGGDPDFYLIRSGSVEIRASDNQLVDRLSAGDGFGHACELASGNRHHLATVLEDCLLYVIPPAVIGDLRQTDANVDSFFKREKLAHCGDREVDTDRDYQLGQRVGDIVTRAAVCAAQDMSVAAAARLMTRERVSSVVVVDSERLVGVVTDRDLRTRVLAANLPPATQLHRVMTPEPQFVTSASRLHDAQLTMMSANIHHLPVIEIDAGVQRPVGMLTTNDLLLAQNSQPLFLIKSINRCRDAAAVARVAEKLPALIQKLIKADARVEDIGRIITSVTDAMTTQLLRLAEQQLGQAPVPYAWLAFGSQGRQDQMLGADQDNALLIDDSAGPGDDDYFTELARFVCDGLHRCGIRYCPGDIMATTPRWRQSLSQWQQYFARWIDEPSAKALMHACIFFDLRHIFGAKDLTQRLTEFVHTRARKNSIFLAGMTENALGHRPPLGFFKTFVLERDGNHEPVLDLKHRGTIPIVDIARIYALSAGIDAVNTMDRLRGLEDHNELSAGDIHNLLDAHEFIARIRIENQGEQLAQGREVTNSLNPKMLSPLVRHQLKEAFAVVQSCQQGMKMGFGGGAL